LGTERDWQTNASGQAQKAAITDHCPM